MKTAKFLKEPGFAIYTSNLKRSFWVPLVLSILNIVIISFAVGSYRFYRGVTLDKLNFNDLASELNNDFILFFLAVAVSALIGCVVFSYLNKVSSAAFVHGLPIGRTQLFFANYLAGVTMILIPAVISAIYMAVRASSMLYALLYLGVYLLYGIGSYSFAVLVSQLCANTLGSLIFTVFGLLTPLICEGFVIYLINENLYGYAGTYDSLTVSRLCYLEPRLVASPYCLIYVCAIVVFTVTALILFKKRAIELAGDLIAFGGMRKAAVYVCGLLAGMCAYLVFGANLFMFLLFGLICAVLVNFAVRKKFTLKGAVTPCAIVTSTVIFIAVLFRFDLTGFERRIPDIESIESVRVYDRFYYNDSTYINNNYVEFKDMHAPITDKGEIELVTTLHKDLLRNKSFYSSDENSRIYNITYKLNNGKTLERKYKVYFERNEEAFAPVSELYAFKRHRHDLLEENIRVLRAEIQGLYGNTVSVDNAEDVKRLHEAIVRDIANTSFAHDHDIHSFRAEPYLSLRIYNHPTKGVYSDGTPVPEALLAENETVSDNENIYPCYTNTLAVIDELYPELLDTELELPGKSYLTVQYGREVYDDSGKYYNGEYFDDVEITDSKVIREIIKECFKASDERTDEKDMGTSYYLHFNIDNRFYFDSRVLGENEVITKYVLEKNPEAHTARFRYELGGAEYSYPSPIGTSVEIRSY